MTYEHALFIDGHWRAGAEGRSLEVVNPADERVIGRLARAEEADLEAALEAAGRRFADWRRVPAHERAAVLSRTAQLLEDRTEEIARLITLEQGKPLAEARLEIGRAVEALAWNAEQATRICGVVYPELAGGLQQSVVPQPIGVVAAFTPWNFPAFLPARKIAPAVAAGCTIILKAAEEAPGAAIALVRALTDAGLPDGVVNLVFGDPAQVSARLIGSPVVRKVSFTGSVPVGKTLASQAGAAMKPCTLELGGHAPTIFFADADLERMFPPTAAFKFRNAGQACMAPSRFYVHEDLYGDFVERFTAYAAGLKVGDGLAEDIDMGPMANPRRLEAMERLVEDAVARGARLTTGGSRLGNRGYFWAPTVLDEVPDDALIMNQEPFGPIVPIRSFRDEAEVVAQANATPYGLAAYVFTRSERTGARLARSIEAGGIGINSLCPVLSETPMGGIKDSGYGYEGGRVGLAAFLHNKLVTRALH